MSDTQAAMREFRFLDDKRKAGGLSPAEEQRWMELAHHLGVDISQQLGGYWGQDGQWYPYPQQGYDPNAGYGYPQDPYAQHQGYYDPNAAYGHPQQGYDPNQYPPQDPYGGYPPQHAYDPSQYPYGDAPQAYPQPQAWPQQPQQQPWGTPAQAWQPPGSAPAPEPAAPAAAGGEDEAQEITDDEVMEVTDEDVTLLDASTPAAAPLPAPAPKFNKPIFGASRPLSSALPPPPAPAPVHVDPVGDLRDALSLDDELAGTPSAPSALNVPEPAPPPPSPPRLPPPPRVPLPPPSQWASRVAVPVDAPISAEPSAPAPEPKPSAPLPIDVEEPPPRNAVAEAPMITMPFSPTIGEPTPVVAPPAAAIAPEVIVDRAAEVPAPAPPAPEPSVVVAEAAAEAPQPQEAPAVVEPARAPEPVAAEPIAAVVEPQPPVVESIPAAEPVAAAPVAPEPVIPDPVVEDAAIPEPIIADAVVAEPAPITPITEPPAPTPVALIEPAPIALESAPAPVALSEPAPIVPERPASPQVSEEPSIVVSPELTAQVVEPAVVDASVEVSTNEWEVHKPAPPPPAAPIPAPAAPAAPTEWKDPHPPPLLDVRAKPVDFDVEVDEAPLPVEATVDLSGSPAEKTHTAKTSEFVPFKPATPREIEVELPPVEESMQVDVQPLATLANDVEVSVDVDEPTSPGDAPVPLATNAEFITRPELTSSGEPWQRSGPAALDVEIEVEEREHDTDAHIVLPPRHRDVPLGHEPEDDTDIIQGIVIDDDDDDDDDETTARNEATSVPVNRAPIPPPAPPPEPPPAPVAAFASWSVAARPAAPVPSPEPQLPPQPKKPITLVPGPPVPMTKPADAFDGSGVSPHGEDTHIVVKGEHRVILHTLEGQVKRGAIRDADLSAEHVALEPGGGASAERIPRTRVKAIFFMLPAGTKAPAAEGQKVRVTFKDGRQVAGFSKDHKAPGPGFFVVPADNRTNTSRIFIFRHSVQAIAVD